MFNLLNSKEMQIADKQTIDNGTPSILLMERAGKAIFNKVKKYINKEITNIEAAKIISASRGTFFRIIKDYKI